MTVREGTTGTLSVEEYARLPPDDGRRHELSRGRLVSEPRPGRAHGATVAMLAHHLVAYALENGGVVTTETGFVLAEDPPTLRGPDLAYVRAEPASYGTPDGFIRGAPDLAVEVASPSNMAADLQEKVLEYFDAGAARVWVVHPRTRTVVVHRSAVEARTLREEETLDDGELLPGFSLPLADLFRR